MKYNITTLPTFLLFRDGKVHETVVGADKMQILNSIMGLFTAVESENGGASGSGGSGWLGAELPRGYGDVTDQIEIKSTELLNFDEEAGSVRVLFDSAKPSALSDAKGADNKAKDWVESDTDEQLMLFLPFQSTLKLHTLQVNYLPLHCGPMVMAGKTNAMLRRSHLCRRRTMTMTRHLCDQERSSFSAIDHTTLGSRRLRI